MDFPGFRCRIRRSLRRAGFPRPARYSGRNPRRFSSPDPAAPSPGSGAAAARQSPPPPSPSSYIPSAEGIQMEAPPPRRAPPPSRGFSASPPPDPGAPGAFRQFLPGHPPRRKGVPDIPSPRGSAARTASFPDPPAHNIFPAPGGTGRFLPSGDTPHKHSAGREDPVPAAP